MKINKIIVIGAGGTGSILIPQLARYLNSIKYKGQLIIADGDAYEDSNSDRQSFAWKYTGYNKAEYQCMAVTSQLPEFKNITFIDNYLSKLDIQKLIGNNTLVINCADNNAIRKYVEDVIRSKNNAGHICCGNHMKSGQVQLSLMKDGESITPSIYEESPDFDNISDDRSELDCLEISELESGGQLIAANMMCASLALNYVIQLMNGAKLHRNGAYIPVGFVGFDVNLNKFEMRSEKEWTLSSS